MRGHILKICKKNLGHTFTYCRQNETSLLPARGRGMVYGGARMLLQLFQLFSKICQRNDVYIREGCLTENIKMMVVGYNISGTSSNSPFVELITPYYHFQMIQADPDDNKFVDCAIAAGARYVVTNDHHFDVLRQTPFPYVDVIALAEFAELLKRM